MLPWKKTRTRIGRWLDQNGISQSCLSKETKISMNTLSDICGDIDYVPRNTTRNKIIKALRKVDPNVSASDFW